MEPFQGMRLDRRREPRVAAPFGRLTLGYCIEPFQGVGTGAGGGILDRIMGLGRFRGPCLGVRVQWRIVTQRFPLRYSIGPFQGIGSESEGGL